MQRAPSDTSLYRLEARRLRATAENGERVVYLEGPVRIDHQTATITCGRGKQYPDRDYFMLLDEVHGRDGTLEMFSDVGEYFGDRNVLVMKGNVSCLEKGWEIVGDRLEYDRARRVATLTGNLKLSDSTRVMYADSIYYDRLSEAADAFGRVVIIDEVEHYSIAGKHARYERTRREAVFDVEPVLSFDIESSEIGTITSEWMWFDVDSKVGIAVDTVRMSKGETRAECDSAVIFDEEERVELYGNPTASNGRSGMTGPRMVIRYNDDEVERVVLPEGGRLTESPAKGSPWREHSWIEGDSVVIHLSSERVDSVRIIGKARAMYYPVEGERGKVSNNFSNGDTMFFRFRNDELAYVRISGSSAGVYNFMNLSGGETIDSLAAAIDTSLKYRDFRRFSEKVRYNSDVIEYFADTESILLRNKAVLNYQNKSLMAKEIDFNSRINVLEATGDPVLVEDEQKMYGIDVGYDMDSEAGVIVDGSTKYDPGYYRGGRIFKVGKDVLKVYNSVYTTCDLASPHYSLRSNKMKVYLKDKIISGPITLYVGEMPVFYLPFMANSLRRDRHSGILRPNFDIGIDSREGRFVRGLGYYWATNDYTDFTVTTDFNERRSFRIHVDNRYKVRYLLDGNVRFNYFRDLDTCRNEWTLKSDHHQSNFWGDAQFNSQLSFVSSDRAPSSIDRAQDISRFVDRRIYSSGTFSRSWGGTRLSLSANRDQTLNVSSPTQARVRMTLPSFSLNLPRTSLWLGEAHKEGERGVWERALGGIMFSPNLSATRSVEESEAREKATLSARSSTGFSKQQKVLFLSFEPSVSMNWNYFKILYDRINPAYADVIKKSSDYTNEFAMSLGSGFGTTLYGTFYPKIGFLRGIRHTINPRASYSYTPKLSEKQTERRSLSYSLRNVVDLKILQGGQEVKQNFFSWTISGSYYPQNPENARFTSISSSFHAPIGKLISIRFEHSYDPYKKEFVSSSMTMGVGLNLGGTFSYPGTWKIEQQERIAAAREEPSPSAEGVLPEVPGAPAGSDQRSWSLGFDYSYSSSGRDISRRVTSKVDITSSVNLTNGWKVAYSAYYDIERRNFTSQRYSISRDLHCWQASFIHRRFGDEFRYYFQIAIKAHPEIMYERGNRELQGGLPYF